MAQARPLPLSDLPVAGAAVTSALVSRVIYCSRAVNPLSASDLRKLTLSAQVRNRNESVTGLLLYDQGRFFQWIEGPKDALERIMQSIRNDPRHTDIHVLQQGMSGDRRFIGWNMKLATAAQRSIAWPQDAIEAPSALIADLKAHPWRAPMLLEQLVPVKLPPFAEWRSDGASGTLRKRTAAVLKTVIIKTVLPGLAAQCLTQQGARPLPISLRVAELADLLIAADQKAAFELIEELHAHATDEPPLYATLFEPVARALGDLWNEDSCSDFDVTLGLGRIQMAVRSLGARYNRPIVATCVSPTVLIAPEPGEIHRLGVTMDQEVLRRAGWSTRCEYPSSDLALQHLLAGTWYDVLDLSLSAAFRREHWLPRLAQTIIGARQASRNTALLVVVGGRVFNEAAGAGTRVGADVASTTAVDLDGAILRRLGHAATPADADTHGVGRR